MGIIAKTLTRGFRNSFFRNQPVHQFYGHLQAVLREISPAGELDNLFARPEFAADSQALPAEIEWSTTLDGSSEMFKDLPPARQKEMANYIGSCLEKIKKYADTKQGKSGKEKDYAEYLKAVAVSPDLNQIFVIKNQPVLVHWGFTCENGSHPGQGMYAGWDEFIAEIHRKAEVKADVKTETRERIVLPPEPPPEVVTEPLKPTKPSIAAAASTVVAKESAAAKAAEPAKQPEQALAEKKPKRVVACGLGDYEWVKWLAIILAIIILLLLLLRIIAPQQSAMSQMPMGGISIMGGGDGGGGFGGAGGSGAGGPPAPGHKCPQCGHMAPTEQPQAPASQQSSQQQTQQGAPPQAQSVSQPVQQSQPPQQAQSVSQPVQQSQPPQQAQPVSQPVQQSQPPQQAQPVSQPVQQPATTVPQNTSQTPPQTDQTSGQQTVPRSNITPVQQPVPQPTSQPVSTETGH